MEKASFILPKFAIFVLLIGTIVPMFGEGQMVIEEVIMEESKPMNGEEKISNLPLKVVVVDENVVTKQGCSNIHEECSGSVGIDCCEGLTCTLPPNSPIGAPGICEQQGCAKLGKMCSGSVGIDCCEGLTCYTTPNSPIGAPGICASPHCARIGQMCSGSIGIDCCPLLACYYPPDSEIGARGICVEPVGF